MWKAVRRSGSDHRGVDWGIDAAYHSATRLMGRRVGASSIKGGELRKVFVLIGLVAALAIPAAALAATLDTGKFKDMIAFGNACDTKAGGNYQGAWYHFVLNQVSGSYLPGVKLTTTFDPAVQDPQNPVGPTAVNKQMQHFWVFSAAGLISANTSGGVDPGPDAKLVLSSVTCGKKSVRPS